MTDDIATEQSATEAPDGSAAKPFTIDSSMLPMKVRRRLEAAYEKKRFARKPLRREANGAMRVDAAGNQYAVAKDGGLRRVVVNEDGVFHVKKWSKARRKAERRAKRVASVAAAGREANCGR